MSKCYNPECIDNRVTCATYRRFLKVAIACMSTRSLAKFRKIANERLKETKSPKDIPFLVNTWRD